MYNILEKLPRFNTIPIVKVENPLFVFLCGRTCTGKTTLLQTIFEDDPNSQEYGDLFFDYKKHDLYKIRATVSPKYRIATLGFYLEKRTGIDRLRVDVKAFTYFVRYLCKLGYNVILEGWILSRNLIHIVTIIDDIKAKYPHYILFYNINLPENKILEIYQKRSNKILEGEVKENFLRKVIEQNDRVTKEIKRYRIPHIKISLFTVGKDKLLEWFFNTVNSHVPNEKYYLRSYDQKGNIRMEYFEIVKHICDLSTMTNDGLVKQINVVRWYNGSPVYDIRTWRYKDGKAIKSYKGVTLSEEEFETLKNFMKGL